MNKSKLKSYAPQARLDFIAAVKSRANMLGLSEEGGALKVAEAQLSGDIAVIAGREWPAKVEKQRQALIAKMQANGFSQTIEAVAYTWFNRFAALRYMELHDYLEHGYRVLSNTTGNIPEIISRATEVELEGLNQAQVVELKLAGNQDGELYRLLLIAQCNALSNAMPFMFERIDDETELLLPDNLLLTDSIVAKLVKEIPEEDWQEVEIIGWFYQFYISEKKDEVIGKVVKSEDIPAATQLFTPNWIVKYMVQNSLGAQWLSTYPDSPLKTQMEYYIDPAEQTDAVNAQLKAITPTELNPEALTLIDPASGSGHILVEAYDLFKAIYLERGYRQRDVPQLILEKNLYGLDIDERAAQLTGFALMMKGRADDRRLFERDVKLNVMALKDSTAFDPDKLIESIKLTDYQLNPEDLTALKQLFEHATTFGSLIQVSVNLANKLPMLKQLSEAISPDMFVSESLNSLAPLVHQAELLASQYDAVVANPPYMGRRSGMNSLLKAFTEETYPITKPDLYACFVDRGFSLAKDGGHNAMVTMQSWLFLSSFEGMRDYVLRRKTIRTLAHLGARAFGSISGEVVQTTVFAIQNANLRAYRPAFFRLVDGGETEKRTTLMSRERRFDRVSQEKFEQIPTSPFAYWCSDPVFAAFGQPKLDTIAEGKQGMATSDNNRFLRYWHEVPISAVLFDCSDASLSEGRLEKWYPYCKGGSFRRWMGNNEYLVNWQRNGEELKAFVEEVNKLRPGGRLKNQEYYFLENITYSALSSGPFSVRHNPPGFLFDTKGSCIFASDSELRLLLGYLNSKVAQVFLDILCPTLDYSSIGVNALPIVRPPKFAGVDYLVSIAEEDWNSFELSWDFQSISLLTATTEPTATLESSYSTWIAQNRDTTAKMKRLEEENNSLFIDAYGLADELTPDVPIEQITLTVNPAYRYGGKLSEEELWTRFRQDTMEELVSYAMGCMMGRYSLDAPGLIYAHSGNEGFDAAKYATFPADDDGIVPITDTLWFEDDAANRVQEFLQAVWGKGSLDENMAWLADNLGGKASETPIETIRRYLSNHFYKDHLQTYKKRPIYWHFSSGKQGAFQALVYLHRYNEGTLARMRSEYVVPLMGKLKARIEMLEKDANSATSTAARNKLNKEIEQLNKKQFELQSYDEKLRHYADMRIKLDLDDGVKVNYGKFGDLLSDVKAITGKK